MGAVYEARDLSCNAPVAIKFVDAELAKVDQVVSRFAREARAASSIKSQNIVTVLDAGADEGRHYLVMELLEGENLGARLRRVGRLPVREALHIVAQVLNGLGHAHAAGIVHRDLKPDNVFLTSRGDDPLFVKIVDFGISKIHRPKSGTAALALTGQGVMMGTPHYMSPEQAQALPDVDARADLYSVGAILFECLGGRPPHLGDTYEQIVLSICMRDAPELRAIVPSTPAEVAEFVARALHRDRTQRFPSTRDMLASLHQLAPEERTLVSDDLDDVPEEPPRPSRKKVALTAIVATAAGVLVAAALVQFSPKVSPSPDAKKAVAPAPEAGGLAQENPPPAPPSASASTATRPRQPPAKATGAASSTGLDPRRELP